MDKNVALHADLVAKIERICAVDRRPFDDVLNEALRAGLYALAVVTPPNRASTTHPRDLGDVRFDLSNIGRAIAQSEGEYRR